MLDLSAPWLRESVAIVNQLPMGLYGFDLAQKLRVPHILAAVIPLTPTAEFPMMGFPAWPSRLPGYNKSGYRLYQRLTWLTMSATINRWRAEKLGLPALSGSAYLGQLRRQPVLYGFSPLVVPRPADWPVTTHITGYWFAEDEAWPPPLPFRRLTAARLAEALALLTHDAGLKARAATLGRQITAEDGIDSALRLLEGYVNRRP